MVKVLVLRGRLDYILFALAVSGSSCSSLCSPLYLDSLVPPKSVQRLEDVEIQKTHFERSKNYFSRAETFVSQQQRYNRQFGNGGISGRVPYHLKREKHFYRSKF